MYSLWLDIRFAVRMMMKNIGVTTFAVLVLALSIGACTAVFSLVNGILLSSLPVPNPHELRMIEWSGGEAKFWITGRHMDDGPGRSKGDSMSYAIFESLQEQCAEQGDVFGFAELHLITVRAEQEPFTAEGLMVSDNFFSVLGAKSLFGRLFDPGDTSGDDARGVVITYPWWEKQFGLDPNALGKSMTLNGHSFTIMGVLPRGFPGVHMSQKTEFYVSMDAQPQLMPDWPKSASDRWWVRVMARKKSGVSDTQFQTAFDMAMANAAADQLKEPKALISDGRAGPAYQNEFYKKPLLLLFSAVCLVILIACANLAGLSLARSASRQHEFAVRAAIGAGRWRLIRQTLTESLILSFLGGALGIVFALWGKEIIARLMTGPTRGLHYDTSLDLKVLGFTFAVMLTTALLSGLLPSLRAAGASPLEGLKVKTFLGALRLQTGRILITTQVALSLLLLTGAGLYVRTLINLVQIETGFDMEKILLFRLNPNNAGYQDEETIPFFERAQESLSAIPGVRSAALSQFALLSGWMSGGGFFTLPDHPMEDGSRPRAHRLTVSETFFSTMGIPLLIGRGFTNADTKNAPKAIVVNEIFVQRYMPDGYPIGEILRTGETDWQIIGVCADAKYTGIKEEVPPTVYYSYRQDPIGSAFMYINTALPPASIVKAARRALSGIDPNVPLTDIATQRQMRDRRITQEWMFAILCGSLSILAVLLSCIGLYGLMAYNVTRRTNEIGVRMALGATRGRIAWPILREALLMSVLGVFIGGLGAFGLTWFIRSQLYGVEPNDPVTFILAGAALLLVGVLAAWLPARRAAKVDPMDALRYE